MSRPNKFHRPRFLCEGCGAVIVAATRLADIAVVEIRHAANCPGEASLTIDPAVDPGRRRWGQERVDAYIARIEAARLAARMPQRRRSPTHPGDGGRR